jgi:hypothetical protein
MIVTLASKYYRSEGDHLKINIDEASINDPSKLRNIAQVDYIDGTKTFIDWGYQNAGATINIGNLILSRDDYDLLLGMKKDNTYTEYLFHYIDQSWPVFITDIQKTGLVREKINTSISLLVTGDPI